MYRVLAIFGALALMAPSPAASQVDIPNRAANRPDEVAWRFFIDVTKPAATADNNNVVFENWASNNDTFRATPPPAFPLQASPKILVVPALLEFAPGPQPHVLALGKEETRRNKAAFDFIVNNHLNTKSGLKAAFAAGNDISFPMDAIEVKANWVPAESVSDPSQFHVNVSDGKRYALLSMHIISKTVPNWTWATFEHQTNAGRCDYTGCRDAFGAVVPLVPAQVSTRGQYPPCEKSVVLRGLMADAGLAAAFLNYCLKGTQVDFVTATGVPTLLGNSVTEEGFTSTSSCMTCHARASTDAHGGNPQRAGFLDPPLPGVCPPEGRCSPSGAPNPAWFW